MRPISGKDKDSVKEANPRAVAPAVLRKDSFDSILFGSVAESSKLVDNKNLSLGLTLSEKKRGRKSRNITDYCEHTENRIKELKEKLADSMTEESQKPKIRNQISAYQARMKAKIQNLDQEKQMQNVKDQISAILQIASNYIPADKWNQFKDKVKEHCRDYVEL